LAVTVSVPTGALEAVHELVPEERVAVQRFVAPSTKETVPVGVPVEPAEASATVAE
jgi:hypothetical protein